MALDEWSLGSLNFNIKTIERDFLTKDDDGENNELVCLRVARFSKVPKIDFRKVRIGKKKTIKFEVFNPNNFSTSIQFKQFSNNDFYLEIANSSPSRQNEPASEEGIPLLLEPDQLKYVFVTWTPSSSGNMREVLTVQWDGGSKLQVIFLGNCPDEPQKKTAKIKKITKTETLSQKINNKGSNENRKALTAIQPVTPARRTTFLVNKHQSQLAVSDENKENSSISPISFKKPSNIPKRAQNSSRNRNTLKIAADNDPRRQTFNISKKEDASRNLFGTSSKKINKKPSAKPPTEPPNPTQPKPFLKRTSISQSLQKPTLKKGLAMKRLKLTKEANQTMPRHPMPFAAKNMFYDERWIEKQERGFTNWLNYLLTPFEENCPADNSQPQDRRETFTIDAQKKQEIAPTREVLSFRAYSLRRRMVQLRRSACRCYQSEDFRFVIHKIEKEVECGLISVRGEKHILADLGIKNQITKLLLSFNSLWLRIGLEVIYGEMILLHSNSDIHNLTKFISTRLLANPDIAAEYAHPTVPNYFKPGYEEALCKFALKKFLLLVCFLDHAKRKHLIDHDPCLFNKGSQIKATRDILLNFSKDFLKGEGDITKHLSYMGITIGHSQTVLDEYDFGIKNISVDLRDGVRLVRVVELLTKRWVLSSKLRLPAVSRLQKVHNVNVALECLKTCGLKFVQDAKCVVDGHREKTLLLLWQIIFSFQVGVLLEVDKLKEEVDYLTKSLKLHKQSLALLESLSGANFLGLDRRDSLDNEDSLYFKSDKLGLLLKWCKTVCAHYDVKIENFTVSFSDGIAFCCLVNFYHPDILPRSLINHETTQTCSVAQQEDGDVEDDFFYDNWTKCFSPNTGVNRRLETLLGNEKENYRVLNESINELGGIPTMLRASDMSNTIPDEKVVITYVSYLCSRLLSIQKETRAARTIQLAWKKYNLSKKQATYQIQHRAATKIQACFRSYITRMNYLFDRECVIICQSVARRWLTLRHLDVMDAAAYVIQCVYRDHLETSRLRYKFLQQRSSAIIIQRVYRQHLHNRLVIYHNAAYVIQQAWRQYRQQQDTTYYHQCATIIQSSWRRYCSRSKFVEFRKAAIVIQQWYRAFRSMHLQRDEFMEIVELTKRLQTWWRGCIETRSRRESFLEIRNASIKIQSWYKMTQQKRLYEKQQQSCTAIQKWWRSRKEGKIVRQEFERTREACILLQAYFRRYLVQREIQRQQFCAKTIQHAWKGHLQTRNLSSLYQKKRTSSILIQSAYRGYVVRRERETRIRAASLIQECWRATKNGDTARKDYFNTKSAVIRLQAFARMLKARRDYLIAKHSAVLIQRAYRRHVTLRQERLVYKMHRSIVIVQSLVRCFIYRSRYLQKRKATIRIQQRRRARRAMMDERQRFESLRSAVITLQSMHKMKVCRQKYLAQKRAAVHIQSFVRMRATMKKYKEMKEKAIQIQSIYRMVLIKRTYDQKRRSCLRIQTWWRCATQQKKYRQERNTVVVLQAFTRMVAARSLYLHQKKSAITLQSTVRSYLASKQYQLIKKSAIKIQATFRAFKSRKEFEREKSAVTMLSSWWKMVCAKRTYHQNRDQIIKMQSQVRCWMCQKKYRQTLNSVIKIQAAYRMHEQQQSFAEKKQAAILVQSYFRCFVQRRKYLNMKKSCVQIQSIVRMSLAKKNYKKTLDSVIVIQKTVKCYQARQRFASQKKAATTIQTSYRTFSCKIDYKRQRNSVIKIQAFARMFQARSKYLSKKHAITLIQSAWRTHATQNRYTRSRNAALKIQSVWRTYLTQKMEREQVIAATRIQSVFRMHVTRNQYLCSRNSAMKIQSYWRMHISRDLYQAQKRSAVKIQTVWRTYQQNKIYSQQVRSAVHIQSVIRMYLQRCQYLKLKSAAVNIQKTYRSHQCQQTFNRILKSAVLIQSVIRMSNEKHQYLEKRTAIVKIQSFVRCYNQRREFHIQKDAALKIQSIYRMVQARRLLSQRKSAALKIQSVWRMVQARRVLCQRKSAALKIQSVWRMVQARHFLSQQKSAALKIQSVWRMVQAKRLLNQHKSAVLKIQSVWRMYQDFSRFQSYKKSSITIQSVWRRYQQQRSYRKHLEGIVKIQSFYRMSRARSRFEQQRNAVIILQGYFRMLASRRVYLQKKQACVQIQTCWRRVSCQRAFIVKKRSAICLQSVLRGFLARKEFARIQESAFQQCQTRATVTIQSTVRMFIARQRFLRQQKACLIIQRRYRAYAVGYPCYLRYHVTRGAVITIQAMIRGSLVRKNIKAKSLAIIRLQSEVKRYVARKRYLELRAAVLVAQKNARKMIAVRRYSDLKRSVVVLQSYVRRALCMRRYNDLKKQHSASQTIQHFFKFVKARKIRQRLQQESIEKESTIVIQQCWSKYKMVKRQRTAATLIQEWYRGMKVARQQWRQYHITRGKVITVQACVRSHLARNSYIEKRSAVMTIQRWWKEALVAKQLRIEHLTHCKACCVIQRAFRRYRQRKAALKIQSVFKMFVQRRQYLILLRATITLQSYWRMVSQQSRYFQQKAAVLTIEQWFASQSQSRALRNEFVLKRKAALKIQSVFKMWVARMSFAMKRDSIISIQSHWRMWSKSSSYQKQKSASLTIQRWYRSQKKSNHTRQQYLEIQKAVRKIQFAFRMSLARKSFLAKQEAVLTIQTYWRMASQRSKYQQQKRAVIILEGWYLSQLQGTQARQHFLKMRQSVLHIQRNYRTWKNRRETSERIQMLVKQTKAVRTIENVYISYISMKTSRDWFLTLRASSITIQRACRLYWRTKEDRIQYNAALIIQSTFRFYLQQKHEKVLLEARKVVIEGFVQATRSCLGVLRIQRWYRWLVTEMRERGERRRVDAVVKFQSLWKGHVVRRKIKDARLKEARERIENANNNATEPMKLCNRTRSALDYLLKVKNLSTVYEALQQLDVSTSLSFRCCQRLVEDNALPVIFRIINYGNRSLPWISIKQVAFSILLNLAKCQFTYRAVYEENKSMEYLIDQMTNFRDKKTFIFPMACNLVTVLVHDDDIRTHLLGRPKIIGKFSSFYKLSERKQKIDTKRRQTMQQEKEQQYCKTAWHRRTSAVNSKDPHLAIQMLVKRLDLI